MRLIATTLLALGLALPANAQQTPEQAAEAKRIAQEKALRERAATRCRENRGADCETDAGLSEWLLQERSREQAESEGSRSIHQTAPVPKPRAD